MGKFKLNLAGFRELRNSQSVQSVLLGHANSIAKTADSMAEDPGGFTTDVRAGRNRAHAVVKAKSPKAAAACQDGNVLLKAVGR